jgi:lysyl-tRNA synthetase class II
MFSHELSINKQLKAKELLENGKHPYGNASKVKRTITTGACREKYLGLLSPESTREEGQQYTETLTGRIKLHRLNGKSGFMQLENSDGIIQLFVSLSEVGEN